MKIQRLQLVKLACVLSVILFLSIKCTKEEKESASIDSEPLLKALPNPTWRLDARCFQDGGSGAFDDLAVKDPSIVYSGGKYHLFYTGRDKGTGGSWKTGYASSTTISGLNAAPRTLLTSLQSGSYFCAPQVFYFPTKGKWFLIYQNGSGASFATSTDVGNPGLWTPTRAMGFSDGIDFWCISDGTNVYCFYSSQDGSHTIKWRRTSIANFPYNWSTPTVCATQTFEAPHVYKNKADGKYYMMVEDIARHQELWSATTLGGTWTKVSEQWAANADLIFNSTRWTDQVSHGEILRSGTNERLEIENIDRCEVLIQGVLNGNYGDYGNIPYDLGVMRNY